jgi:hypothetical protein
MSLTVNDDLNFLDDDIEDDSEDFDPNALLSEPLMDDDSIEFGLLSSDPSNFEPEPPTFQFNGSSQQKVQGPVQYESFQQPQHQQQQSFNNFIQTKTRHTPHNPLQNGRSGQDTFLPLNDSDSHIQESQQAVTMRMQELQQQIHQVQNQIQHVQYQSSQLELQSSQREDPSNVPQPQNSQGYNVQGMVNNAGMSRNPPDRSVSAPVMPRSGNFSRGFMEAQQQPQAQAPSLAAMAASLQRGQQTDDSSQSFGKQSAQGQDPGNVSEAMEKLCESMRRSAMSRNMVRQLSGRSAPTSRGMGKSKSGGLVRGNMSRTHSGADALVRPGPIRRLTHDSKHRIQRDALSSSGGPPGRGVFRHKSSQGALAGTTRSQIDDNTRGKF